VTPEVMTMPVGYEGLLTPSPFRKTVTTDPDAAGLVQLF